MDFHKIKKAGCSWTSPGGKIDILSGPPSLCFFGAAAQLAYKEHDHPDAAEQAYAMALAISQPGEGNQRGNRGHDRTTIQRVARRLNIGVSTLAEFQ